MKDQSLPIHPYGWNELAQLYSPALSSSAQNKQLLRWIRNHPQLRDELAREGWVKGTRRLTSMQVRIIVSYLGEP